MSRSSARVGRRKSPGLDTPSTGHGFGLSWQKRRKPPRELPRQDGEIPLHIAGGDPGRLAGELIGSDRKARLATGLRDSRCRTTHAQDLTGAPFQPDFLLLPTLSAFGGGKTRPWPRPRDRIRKRFMPARQPRSLWMEKA